MDNKVIEELLTGVADGLIIPEGRVTVQIRDERGKIRDEETQPNFISKSWKLHARALLRTRWQRYGYNPLFGGRLSDTALGNPMWASQKHVTPRLANGFIAAWNQTSAEDAVNEHKPVIPATGIIAWASRHPYGSATGSRGNVNPVESDMTEDRVRFVFDWLTSQGNGTFQSVGWLPMSYPGINQVHFGKAFRRRAHSAQIASLTTYIAGTTTGYWASAGWVDPSDGKFYFLVGRYNQSGGPLRVLSVPFVNVMDDSTELGMGAGADIGSLAFTAESDEFTPTSVFTTATTAPPGFYVIGRDGTNTIFIYQTTANNESQVNNSRWGKIGASGASTTYAPGPGGITGHFTGCVISGFAYLVSTYAGTSIYKHNISTGALDSTITLDAACVAAFAASGLTTPRIESTFTDGTDIYITAQSLVGTTFRYLMLRINTSGALQEIIGHVPGYASSPPANTTESSAAPYNAGTGVYIYDSSALFEISNEYFQGVSIANAYDHALVSGANASDPYIVPTVRLATAACYQFYTWYDGEIFMVANTGSFTGVTQVTSLLGFSWFVYRRGFDLGSRVLLSGSKTKLNTETMKITYDVLLPGWTD